MSVGGKFGADENAFSVACPPRPRFALGVPRDDVRVCLVDGHELASYISTQCSADLRTDNPNGRKASGDVKTTKRILWLPRWYKRGGLLSVDQTLEQVTKLYFGGLLISPKAERTR